AMLDVEPEVHHVAVLHHVVLALDAHLARGLQGGLRAVLLEVVGPVDLGADEAALDVAVHLAGGLSRGGAAADGPRAALVGAGREEADEIEHPVRGANEAVARGLAEAEAL